MPTEGATVQAKPTTLEERAGELSEILDSAHGQLTDIVGSDGRPDNGVVPPSTPGLTPTLGRCISEATHLRDRLRELYAQIGRV